MKNLELLAFAPHPDDAEIFCGGLLAKMALAGYSTGIVDLTAGELGTRGTVADRQRETAAASKILKLSQRENLSIPDCGIFPNNESQVNKVIETLRRLKPTLILIPYWQERHVDHVAASQLLTRAVFLAGLKNYQPALGLNHTPKQILYYQQRFQFKPTFIVDISSVFKLKRQAIESYASQVAPDAEQPKTVLSSELNLPSLEARDRYHGAMIGVAYAEAYYCRNSIALGDPVLHFKQHPADAALFFPESHD